MMMKQMISQHDYWSEVIECILEELLLGIAQLIVDEKFNLNEIVMIVEEMKGKVKQHVKKYNEFTEEHSRN